MKLFCQYYMKILRNWLVFSLYENKRTFFSTLQNTCSYINVINCIKFTTECYLKVL